MIKPIAIDHLVLRSSRPQALIAFYCNIIGCTVERETTAAFGLTQLRAGNALIDIVDVAGEIGQLGGASPNIQGNNLDHFCLQIAAFDEAELMRFLDQQGVAQQGFEDRYGASGMGRSIYIKDIDGNNLELRAAL